MKTLLIELTDNKAYKLLRSLEEMKFIRVLRNPGGISNLGGNIKSPKADANTGQQSGLGDLLSRVQVKKAYVGPDSKSAMEKVREKQNQGF